MNTLTRNKVCGLMLAASAFIGMSACGPMGDIDSLTDDVNGNGFLDVDPPEGVTFDTATNINVGLINEIQKSDVSALVGGIGVSPQILNALNVTVPYTITLDYGDGIVHVLEDSETLAPFERRFEFACPELLNFEAVAEISAPILGNITTLEIANISTPVDCGTTFEAFVVDNNGTPGVQFESSPNQ